MYASRSKTDLRVLLPIAVALFALSYIVRFMLADFPKGIGVLPDEIRYLDLASSLLNAGELIQRGGFTSFQKILYPLSVIPAYLMDDPQLRVRVIAALNCLYVSSSVFPALLLARRVLDSKRAVVLCMVLTLISPDLCYSMTFLSENVYLPLALWLIWWCLVALERRGRAQWGWCAGAGVLCYLAYLCKEVALGFVLALCLMLVIRAIRSKGERRSTLIALACFLAGFCVPFAIMKFTLFAGLLNSYNQADPSVLLNPYTVLFTLYALASDLTHFAIAFAFFPLVFPLFTWSRLEKRERDFYAFCLLSFAFILLAVVYTISIREDLGHVGIRPHVRYVAPIFLPLFFLFVRQVMRGDGIAIMLDPGSHVMAVATTLSMLFLSLAFIGTGDYAQGFDSAQFHVMRWLGENLPSLPIDPSADPASPIPDDDIYHGDYFGMPLGAWLAKACIALYLVLGLIALIGRKRRKWGMVLVALIAVFMLLNNAAMYQYNASVYTVAQEDVEEVCIIEGFVDGLPDGEQVLIVYDNASSGPNNLLDVYVDNDRLNCNYIKVEDFKRVVSEGDGSQKSLLVECDSTMGDNIFGANGRIADENAGISYLITNSSQRIRLMETCAHDVTPEGLSNFYVHRIEPGAPLVLRTAFMR